MCKCVTHTYMLLKFQAFCFLKTIIGQIIRITSLVDCFLSSKTQLNAYNSFILVTIVTYFKMFNYNW